MLLCYDLESTGLSPYGSFQELGYWPARPFAFAFRAEDGRELYFRFDVDPMTREVLYQNKPSDFKALKELLECPGLELVGHNISFDLTLTAVIGINFKGKFWDTRILSHCADSSRSTFALKPLCQQLFDIGDEDQKDLLDTVKKARRLGKKLGWKLADDVKADFAYGDPELCKKYALRDVERTLKLYKFYEPLLNGTFPEDSPYHKYRELVEMEHALVPIVMGMTRTGVALGIPKVATLKTYYEECIVKTRAEMTRLGYPDLNPKSPLQVKKVFYEDLKMPKVFRKRKQKDGTKKETLTCDKKVLDRWAKKVPLAKALVEMSEAQHQLNSFILPFQENSFDERDNRVLHPSFNTCGPITGRMSCSNPNLQNITSSTSPGRKSDVEFRARECFVPRRGQVWLLADYSQVEIWVAAFFSKDPLMTKTLLEGKSVHDLTCDRVFGHKIDFNLNRAMYRKLAKILNFSVLYGSGILALMELLDITKEEAVAYLETYRSTYVGIAKLDALLKKLVKDQGWVKDVFHRPYFPKSAHKALNYIVQGTAAGILKRAMISAFFYTRQVSPASKLLLSIHDELVFEVPKEDVSPQLIEGIKSAMAGEFHKLLGMPQPFEIEVSITETNWAEKSKITEEDLMVFGAREEEEEV